jgi:tight adherence protein B
MEPLIVLSTVLVFAAVMLGALWIGPVWDALSRRYVGDLVGQLRCLGVESKQIARSLRWWGIAIFGTFFVLAVPLRMVPVACGAAYLVIVAPRYVLGWRIARQRILLRDQMVRAAVALANSARAGLSQAQGLEAISRDAPEPLAAEFRRIVHDYQAGRPLADALEETQKRLDLEAFTVFSTVLMICMERGGNICFALERISSNLQELQRLQRKVEADTAAGRRTALLLGIFPFVFLLGTTVLDPAMMRFMYTTSLGQFILLGVGAMVYGAFRWCLAILNVEF